MYACISKTYVIEALWAVNILKYIQAAVLPYVTLMTYLNGTRHDMFLTAFSLLKTIFNIADATVFVN